MASENREAFNTWDRVRFYANPIWALPADNDFICVNQRLWSQHLTNEEVFKQSQVYLTEKHHYKRYDKFNETECVLTVQDVIPESKLARFYGSFIYDIEREKRFKKDNCDEYTFIDSKDATEFWMSPEVNELYRKYVPPLEDMNSMAVTYNMSLGIKETHDLSSDSLFPRSTIEKECLTVPFEVHQPQHLTPNTNESAEGVTNCEFVTLPEILDTKYMQTT